MYNLPDSYTDATFSYYVQLLETQRDGLERRVAELTSTLAACQAGCTPTSEAVAPLAAKAVSHPQPFCTASMLDEAFLAKSGLSADTPLYLQLPLTSELPVAAQCRVTKPGLPGCTDWAPCTIEHHYQVAARPSSWPDYETRLLYEKPQANCSIFLARP